MEAVKKELERLERECPDPIDYADQAYRLITERRGSGQLTSDQAYEALVLMWRHLWEVL